MGEKIKVGLGFLIIVTLVALWAWAITHPKPCEHGEKVLTGYTYFWNGHGYDMFPTYECPKKPEEK